MVPGGETITAEIGTTSFSYAVECANNSAGGAEFYQGRRGWSQGRRACATAARQSRGVFRGGGVWVPRWGLEGERRQPAARASSPGRPHCHSRQADGQAGKQPVCGMGDDDDAAAPAGAPAPPHRTATQRNATHSRQRKTLQLDERSMRCPMPCTSPAAWCPWRVALAD